MRNLLFVPLLILTLPLYGQTVFLAPVQYAAPAAGAPSSWTPHDTTNVFLWLKADGLALSNNDSVGTWYDSSGNARNLIFAGATGVKPVFKTNIVNTKPIIRFDGTNHSLLQTSGVCPAGYSISSFFVVKNTSSTTDSYFFDFGATLSRSFISGFVDGKWEWYAPAPRNVIGDISTATFTVITDTTAVTSPDGTIPLYLGGDGVGSSSWDGDVAEILIIGYASGTTFYNAAGVTRAVTYLKTKYGLP
jgi:hypothetical protein